MQGLQDGLNSQPVTAITKCAKIKFIFNKDLVLLMNMIIHLIKIIKHMHVDCIVDFPSLGFIYQYLLLTLYCGFISLKQLYRTVPVNMSFVFLDCLVVVSCLAGIN